MQLTLESGRAGCVAGVVDPDGNPVAGAALCACPKAAVQVLQGNNPGPYGARTARFLLKDITPGLNGLDARVAGDGKVIKVRSPWDALQATSGQEIGNATIVLEIAAAGEVLEIAGQVVDAARKPVADVEVMVNGPSSSGNAWSSAEGAFRVKGLKPGPYRVNAKTRLPGLHGEVTLEAVEAGTEGMEIVLPATGGAAGARRGFPPAPRFANSICVGGTTAIGMRSARTETLCTSARKTVPLN